MFFGASFFPRAAAVRYRSRRARKNPSRRKLCSAPPPSPARPRPLLEKDRKKRLKFHISRPSAASAAGGTDADGPQAPTRSWFGFILQQKKGNRQLQLPSVRGTKWRKWSGGGALYAQHPNLVFTALVINKAMTSAAARRCVVSYRTFTVALTYWNREMPRRLQGELQLRVETLKPIIAT